MREDAAPASDTLEPVVDDKDVGEAVAVRELQALPPGVLWQIAKRAGRHSRRVSRALLDAYGALDCGLVPPYGTIAAGKELKQLLQSGSGARLHAITALELGTRAGSMFQAGLTKIEPELIALIAQTLTSLRSLETAAPIPGTHLPLLLPLAPTLTRLDVGRLAADTGPAHVQGLQQLSNLRSLTVGGVYPDVATRSAWLQALGCMPQLIVLSWYAEFFSPRRPWGPQWVSDLAPQVPQLISLSLGFGQQWDKRTIATLQQQLTSLQSLSLGLMSPRADQDTAVVDTHLLGALSHCSRISAIHLRLELDEEDTPSDLSLLSSVQLASLSADFAHRSLARHQAPLLQALRVQWQLTQLQVMNIGSRGCVLVLSEPLPTSLVKLRVAGHWSRAGLLPLLQRLPALRELDLDHYATTAEQFSMSDTAHLSALTQLHELSIEDDFNPPGLFSAISALTGLRALTVLLPMIHAGTAEGATMPRLTDAHLLPLAKLTGVTRLLLNIGLGSVATTPGVVAMLRPLTNLQHLGLVAPKLISGVSGWEGVLVELLLVRVQRLASLSLALEGMSQRAKDALVRAADAHGCNFDSRMLFDLM